MRTREEQVADVFPGFYAEDDEATVTKGDLMLMLEYAERRAEQRVRAEIGRDSERLDWLTGAVREVSRVSNRPTRWILEFRTSLDSLDRGTLRQAIDAVMEAE